MTEDNEVRLPVVEETVSVTKQKVRDGLVRVSTRTDTVKEIATAALQADKIEITRVPVDREVASAPSIRTEGDVTVIPVLEERVVVETRLFLMEEVHVRRVTSIEQVDVPLELRKQKLVVERATEEPQPPET